MDWRPSASIETLRERANLINNIRAFFNARNILEVETPLLCQHTVTDPHISSFKMDGRFLQTSPEYGMKRLLAANSGAIFQICKAFRQEESGHRHNPEFSLLEWYQPDFTHHDLMDEVDLLLMKIGNFKKSDRLSYRELFKIHCGFDPIQCDDSDIKTQIKTIDPKNLDRDTCLQLLLSEKIEPSLGKTAPTFIYDFPVSQAALAKIRDDTFPVAERFEVFIDGIEIANGFHELTDATEQRERFQKDQAYRQKNKKNVPDIDERFISALEAGLPTCAGVALGIDRLLMCLLKKEHIQQVMSFHAGNA